MMRGHTREKERLSKIGKFMKKCGGIMEDRLRFPRKYLCAIMICAWHVIIVMSSSIIFNTLFIFWVVLLWFSTKIFKFSRWVGNLGSKSQVIIGLGRLRLLYEIFYKKVM